MGLAPRSQPLIGCPHNFVRQVAILHCVPPIAIDAEHLNVNPALIHFPNALISHGSAAGVSCELSAGNDRCNFGDGGVRMDIHHADTPASHLNDSPRHWASGRTCRQPAPLHGAPSSLSAGGFRKSAAQHQRTSGAAGYGLNKIPAIRHGLSLRNFQFAIALFQHVLLPLQWSPPRSDVWREFTPVARYLSCMVSGQSAQASLASSAAIAARECYDLGVRFCRVLLHHQPRRNS